MSRFCLRLRPAVALLLGLAMLGAAVPARAAEGTPLQGLHGGSLSQSDLSQGATILVFWASWSPPCATIVQRVNPLAQRWGGKARVVTVSFQEDSQTVESFLSGKSLSVDVFLDADGAFSKKYAVAKLPGLVVIKDGRVVYSGKLPDDADRVIGEILG